MKAAVQVDSELVELEFSADVLDDAIGDCQVILKVRRSADGPSVSLAELASELQLRAHGIHELFSCVTSLDEDSNESELVFDCTKGLHNRFFKDVDVLWKEEKLGTLPCSRVDDEQRFESVGYGRLPPEIVAEELPDGRCYRLPKRPFVEPRTWTQRFADSIIVSIGLAWVVVMITGAATAIETAYESDAFVGVVYYVVAGVCCIATFPGLIPAAFPFRFLFDCGSEVELSQGRLTVTERIGPFRWRQSRQLDLIMAFEIYGPVTYFGRRWRRRRVNDPFILALGDKPLHLALGYPPRWLDSLARELADHINRERLANDVAVANLVEIQMSPIDRFDPKKLDVEEQPPDSLVKCESTSTSVTFDVRPTLKMLEQCRRGVPTAVVFCVFNTVLTGMLTTFVIWYGFRNAFVVAAVCFVGLLLTCFWFIALGILWEVLTARSHQITISADGKTLTIVESGPIRHRLGEFRRDQIAVIRPGSVEVPDADKKTGYRRAPELQIHLHDGRRVGLLGGQPRDDVYWIATLLRRTLNVPAVDGGKANTGSRWPQE